MTVLSWMSFAARIQSMNVIDNLRLLAVDQPDAAELLLANPAVPDEHVQDLLSTATQEDSGLLISLASNTGLSATRFRQLVAAAESLTQDQNPEDKEGPLLTVLLCEAVSNPALPADLLARGGRALTKSRAGWTGDVLSHPNLPREVYIAMVDAVLAGHFPEDRSLLETFLSREVLDYYGSYVNHLYELLRPLSESIHFTTLFESTQTEILSPREIVRSDGSRSMRIFPMPKSASTESLRTLYKRLRKTDDLGLHSLLVNAIAHHNFPVEVVDLEDLKVSVSNGVLVYDPEEMSILAALRSTEPAALELLELVVRTDGNEDFCFHDATLRILGEPLPREESLLNAVLDRIAERGDRFVGADLHLLDRIVRNPAVTAEMLDRIAGLIPDSDLDSWTVRSVLLHPLVARSTRLWLLSRLSQGTHEELDYREDLVRYVTAGTIPLKKGAAWLIYRLERNQLNAQFWTDHLPGPGVHNEVTAEHARKWLHAILEQRSELVVDGVMRSQEIEDILVDLIYDLLVPGRGTEADWLNLAMMFGVVGKTARRSDGITIS